MERQSYDLSHFSFMAGQIGRLQTLSVLPVVAGDSVNINLEGVFRLSPLRRNLTVDASLDLFAFYTPYRHIYGDDWINFIKQGVDEAVTFSTLTVSGAAPISYAGARSISGTVPLWPTATYNRIWNRYFRVPTDTGAVLTDTDYNPGNANGRLYGRLCARPKSIWTTGIDATTDASDREVTVTASQLDILDLEQVKARYRTEQARDWFAQRYNDVLKDQYGSSANTDADERPTLLMRKTRYLSGYDVDGTADATLGTYSGKSAAVCGMNVPPKFCPEHGSIFLMALLRFPSIHEHEVHYLQKKSQPTYKEISGDPTLLSSEPPIIHEIQDFFAGSSSSTPIGSHPYGQWYRHQPNLVHEKYDSLNGFAFTHDVPSTLDECRYLTDAEFDSAFSTTQLGQWQSSARIDVTKKTVVPGPLTSVFAGAN